MVVGDRRIVHGCDFNRHGSRNGVERAIVDLEIETVGAGQVRVRGVNQGWRCAAEDTEARIAQNDEPERITVHVRTGQSDIYGDVFVSIQSLRVCDWRVIPIIQSDSDFVARRFRRIRGRQSQYVDSRITKAGERGGIMRVCEDNGSRAAHFAPRGHQSPAARQPIIERRAVERGSLGIRNHLVIAGIDRWGIVAFVAIGCADVTDGDLVCIVQVVADELHLGKASDAKSLFLFVHLIPQRDDDLAILQVVESGLHVLAFVASRRVHPFAREEFLVLLIVGIHISVDVAGR